MAKLLVIREQIKQFVTKNENFLKPISKFILAIVTFFLINSKVGFASKLSNGAAAIILSLLASFLPTNFIVVISMLLILLHLYSLSLACVLVVGAIFILMFLLYFRFSPKDTILLLFTPICFALKMPYIVPLSAGLVSSSASIVSVGCGTITYFILDFISGNASSFISEDKDSLMNGIRFLLDAIVKDKEMAVIVVAFSFTIIVVNIIRRLSVDHSWTIAIVTGTLADIFIVLVGDLKFGTYISVVGLILGSIAGVLVVIVIKFFVFNVDYSRTEKVQFEDDEYYYYVKAVPKNTVALDDRKVKRIKSQVNQEPSRKRTSGSRENDDAVEYRVRRSTTREASSSRGSRSENFREGGQMTEIERAAAAKARAERNKRK